MYELVAKNGTQVTSQTLNVQYPLSVKKTVAQNPVNVVNEASDTSQNENNSSAVGLLVAIVGGGTVWAVRKYLGKRVL